MSSWISAVPAFLIALLVVLGPGLALSWAGGARGLLRWALAAPLSFSLAGLGAIGFAVLGIPFTPLSFSVLALLCVIIAAGLRVLARRRWPAMLPTRSGAAAPSTVAPRAPSRSTLLIVGVLGGLYAFGAVAGRIMRGVGRPENVAQLFDNVFHLNATRLIADTGEGSSLTLGNLNEASRSFYPAAFHDVAALIMTSSGSDAAVALNVTSLVLAGVVWPLSLVFLATRMFGTHAAVVAGAAVIAPALGAFPYRMLSFGVLYPFMAGLSMLPALLGMLIMLLTTRRAGSAPSPGLLLACLGAAPGIALTHPSVIIAVIVFAVPFVIQHVIIGLRDPAAGRAEKRAVLVAGLALVGAALVCFLLIRPPLSSAPWDAIQSYKEGMGAVLTVSPGIISVQWGVFALTLIGVVSSIRHGWRRWPVVAVAAIGATLYFASATFPSGLPRDLLTGVWYRDTQRLAALFAIAAAPLAVLGFVRVCRVLETLVARMRPVPLAVRARMLVALTGIVVVSLASIVLTQRGTLREAETWLAMSFANGTPAALLDEDERSLLAEVPDVVPADEVVVGDPRTGASLVYAFSGRWTTAPHIFGVRTPKERYLLEHWDEAGTDPRVCPIIRELDAYWALDFGAVDVLGANRAPLEGTDALSTGANPGILSSRRVGDAALYEAAVCR